MESNADKGEMFKTFFKITAIALSFLIVFAACSQNTSPASSVGKIEHSLRVNSKEGLLTVQHLSETKSDNLNQKEVHDDSYFLKRIKRIELGDNDVKLTISSTESIQSIDISIYESRATLNMKPKMAFSCLESCSSPWHAHKVNDKDLIEIYAPNSALTEGNVCIISIFSLRDGQLLPTSWGIEV